MNYLAHAYLSFRQPGIVAGNLISDFVKGKKQFEYPEAIRKGIILHRQIDQFTDNHSVTREAKQVFRPYYRLYAGAFTDVVYDHFLACDGNEFGPGALQQFAQDTYRQLEFFIDILPLQFRQIFPYMRQQNWLYHYQHAQGIQRSMAGLVRRSAWLKESDTAFFLFETHYHYFQDCYNRFFPSLKKFATEQLSIL